MTRCRRFDFVASRFGYLLVVHSGGVSVLFGRQVLDFGLADSFTFAFDSFSTSCFSGDL